MEFNHQENVVGDLDKDCFNHHQALDIVQEDKEAFKTTKTQQWNDHMAKIFANDPTMEPEDPTLVESSATKVGASMDILATFIWPRQLESSEDELVLVCKKWGKEIANTFNFPRPQTLTWAMLRAWS